VYGVVYTDKDGATKEAYGPVIIATGGYAADFAPDGLLQEFRPNWLHLPTTNGEHSTGDGIKMLRSIGGGTVDLEAVQVHPTGLVQTDERDAKVKWLAAEALRGVGGLILDCEGQRFCNDIGTRDYVTERMWNHNKPPYRLVLNSTAAASIEWHCKHYEGRRLMKRYASGHELAKEMGIDAEKLSASFEHYNQVAKTGNDTFGKKYFDSVPFKISDSFYVAEVVPVLHYTMGGIQIDTDAACVRKDGTRIPGIYGAGEVNGGIHGLNRLGGSSLLDCVVFGRVAGASAAKYLLSENLKRGPTVGGQGPINLKIDPQSNRLTVDISWGNQSVSTSTGTDKL